MDSKRILALGVPSPNFKSGTLSNPPNLGEFSGVIWAPSSASAEWHQNSSNIALTVKRFLELTEWTKEGNVLAVLGAPPESFEPAYIEKGVGRSYNFLASEIFNGVSFRHTSGSLVEYCGPDNLSGQLEAFANSISYNAIIDGKNLTPLFRVSNASTKRDQIIGAFKALGSGTVLFIPWLGKGGATEAEAYYRAALSIPEYLQKTYDEQGPDWLVRFQTLEEQKANQNIESARIRIQEIEAEITKFKRAAFLEQSGKILFTGTGDPFANAVAEVLRELGMKVIEGPKQRADLIAWDGKRLAAIEAKGLEGGAREKNIAQAKRWAADVNAAYLSSEEDAATDVDLKTYREKLSDLGVPPKISEDELECKGIVILGTFRKMPLDERPASFNDPVLALLWQINKALRISV